MVRSLRVRSRHQAICFVKMAGDVTGRVQNPDVLCIVVSCAKKRSAFFDGRSSLNVFELQMVLK